MPAYYPRLYDSLSACYHQLAKCIKSSAKWKDFDHVWDPKQPRRSFKNIEILASSLCMWQAILYDLSSDYKWTKTFVPRIFNEYQWGFERFFKDLSKLVDVVRNTMEWPEILAQGFPLVILEPLCVFPMWRTDASQFRKVHTAYNYLTRVCIDRDVLEEQAYNQYLEPESKPWPRFSPTGDYYLAEMRDSVSGWMEKWDESLIPKYCKFSSGSTADAGKDLAAKTLCFDAIPEPVRRLLRTGPTPDFLEKLQPNRAVELSDSQPPYDDLDPWSQLVFVPKTALKKRTIAMEVSMMNFFQNGVDASIRMCSTFPKKLIRFEDQSFSRKLALEASETGELATVDFSAASDSVLLEIVRRLFSEVRASDPSWVYGTRYCEASRLLMWLEATRSTTVYYGNPPDLQTTSDGEVLPRRRKPSNGDTIPIMKFAAMGSVTCFTVESMVFLAMAILACKLAKVPFRGCVYGDDVILPAVAVPYLRMIAEELGFKINESKTFAKGPFREACGIYAYKGVDVTTPSHPRQYVNFFKLSSFEEEWLRENTEGKVDNVNYAQLVQLNQIGNELWDHGLYFSRYVCLRLMISSGALFASGNPDLCDETFAPPIKGNQVEYSHREVPCAPLFVYSYRDRISLFSEGEVVLPTPLTLTSKKRMRLAPEQVAISPEDRVLSVPQARHKTAKLVIREGVGFKNLTFGSQIIPQRWTGEQRLRIWLYQAEFCNRQNLFDQAEWIPPLREPCIVSKGVVSGVCSVKRSCILSP